MFASRATFLLLAVLGGCHPPPAEQMRPALGAPLSPPMGTWTWVDFPSSSCADGTPTGIGVNQGPRNALLVFMNGGATCWDYLTCYALSSKGRGPFGQADFDAAIATVAKAGSVFDRSDASNPFKDWSYVFIPYCTGDVHAGDNVVTYANSAGTDSHEHHHVGHRNLLAYLPRIAGTWPAPDKLVVSGSSAGGYGTTFNYDTFRAYWPTGKVYRLDDSGPLLEGSAIPDAFRAAWYAQWRLDKLLDPLCGEACKTDLSQAVKRLAERHPQDRMALLSSLQDKTIRGYFLLSASAMEDELLRVTRDVLDALPNHRTFYVGGETHTMLRDAGTFSAQGTSLQSWLGQLVSDDPAWGSR